MGEISFIGFISSSGSIRIIGIDSILDLEVDSRLHC